MENEENSLEEVLAGVEPTSGTFTETDESETKLTKEQLVAELRKTRDEAAKARISKKELAEKAAKYDEWEKSQLSETDRLKAELEELRETTKNATRDALVATVAADHGLDADDASRLRGTTKAELVADAKVLAAKRKAPSANAAGMRAGNRGGPVDADGDTSGDSWIRNLLK